MVRRCVAAGCSNTHKDGVSLFRFPRDRVMRKKWADQVKRHRAKWEPTDYSALCSRHFEQSCFRLDTLLTQSLGLGKKKASLNPDAVPTLFWKPVKSKEGNQCGVSQPTKKRKSAAYEKRERLRIIEALLNEQNTVPESTSQENLGKISGKTDTAPPEEHENTDMQVTTNSVIMQEADLTATRDVSIQCSLLSAPLPLCSGQNLT